jgi:adenine-specific DNA methylase
MLGTDAGTHVELLAAGPYARLGTRTALLSGNIKRRVRGMALRHRKLGPWSALPPYLGGKRRLCPLIFREVDRILPRKLWPGLSFLDGFLGGGSVSLYAKAQGFSVVATDIAARAMVVGEALIANSRVRLTREDVLRLAATSAREAGRVERQYCPEVFTREQARFLDRAFLLAAQTSDPAKAALYRLLAIRVALLAHPMSQVRKGTIHRITTGEYESITESCLYHYIDGLRLTRPKELWQLAQQVNAGVFQGEGRVLQRSVLEALPEIEAAVAYFDPPYPGVMSYEKEYRIIDELLEGQARPTSPFTAKTGADLLDQLFKRALHIPVWLLSLGNAVVGIDDLERKMKRLGRETKAIELRYQHLAAVATEEKKATNREFLVVGWDGAAVKKLLAREPRDDAAGVEFHDLAPALVEEDASHGRTLGAATESLAGDGFEEREASLSQDAVALGGKAVSVAESGLDDPHAILAEGGVALDCEGRIGTSHE